MIVSDEAPYGNGFRGLAEGHLFPLKPHSFLLNLGVFPFSISSIFLRCNFGGGSFKGPGNAVQAREAVPGLAKGNARLGVSRFE